MAYANFLFRFDQNRCKQSKQCAVKFPITRLRAAAFARNNLSQNESLWMLAQSLRYAQIATADWLGVFWCFKHKNFLRPW
jgi:hypothetical protein